VTVIEARPNKVIQIKTRETDGYNAVQVGYMELKENRANKPTKGHFKRWDAPLKKYLAEVRLEEGEEYAPGQEIKVSSFEEGRKIDVTGTSKGKGTQGNIKRHGHHRGPMSHGSKHKRLPGALAAGTYPSRVFKGTDGPGRMGNETVTVQNLDLVKIIPERNLLLIKGAVPGGRGGIVCVRYAVKAGYPDDVRLAVREEYVEEVIEAAEEEAVAAPEAAPETGEEVTEKDPETVEEVIEALEEVVKEAEETIKEGAEEVIEKVEEVAVEATDAIETFAPEVVEAAEAIEEVAAEAAGAVAEATPEAVDAVEEAAGGIAPGTVEEAVTEIAAVVTEVALEVTEKEAEKAVAEEAAEAAEEQVVKVTTSKDEEEDDKGGTE